MPDVGTGVLVRLPRYKAGAGNAHEMEEYYGIYLGHGQSKTAFEFMSISKQRARFDGKVLKVAGKTDMEPSVCKIAVRLGVTTSILHEGGGVDETSGKHFHCWITDRCIPLDDLCRYEETMKSTCSLAAFCCILRAAQQRLYLSD